MTVVVGTTINYFLDGHINRDDVLFPGVACFLIAVFLGAAVHSSNAKDDEQKLSMKNAGIELSSDASDEAKLLPDPEEPKDGEEDSYSASNKPKPGTAEYIIQVEGRRSIKAFGSHRLAGACSSLFSSAINLATNDQWHALRKGVPHLYHPMACVPASTVRAYARDWNGRHCALLAGLLCGFGNGFQFMGGQAAGYAAADAVQALPLVSTFWGVILFVKYRRSSKKTYLRLAAMLLMFIIAVAVLMASAGHRKAIDANANETAQHLHIQHPLLNIPRI
ncbi:unnamed protein product [Urochloa humidicola]